MRNGEGNLSYNILLYAGKANICTASFKLYNAFLEAKVKSKISETICNGVKVSN